MSASVQRFIFYSSAILSADTNPLKRRDDRYQRALAINLPPFVVCTCTCLHLGPLDLSARNPTMAVPSIKTQQRLRVPWLFSARRATSNCGHVTVMMSLAAPWQSNLKWNPFLQVDHKRIRARFRGAVIPIFSLSDLLLQGLQKRNGQVG